MYVIFNDETGKEKAMVCFYENRDKQSELMYRMDIDRQVKEWQKTNSGQPPKFYNKVHIKEFTNRKLQFSNI